MPLVRTPQLMGKNKVLVKVNPEGKYVVDLGALLLAGFLLFLLCCLACLCRVLRHNLLPLSPAVRYCSVCAPRALSSCTAGWLRIRR